MKTGRISILVVSALVVSIALSVVPAQAQSGVIAYGDNVLGSLSPTAPIMFYSFNGNVGDLVTVHVLGVTPGMAPSISLLSPTQVQLALSSGDPFGLGDGTEARLSHRLTTAGVHVLLVSDSGGLSGDYLLRLRGEAQTLSEVLAPDAPATFDLSDTQLQQFAVAANPAEAITASITTTVAGFTFSAVVRNPVGSIVAMQSGSADQPVNLIIPPGTGTYEVRILNLSPGVPGLVTIALGSLAVSSPVESPPQPSPTAQPQEPAATEDVAPPPADSEQICTVSSGGTVNLRSGPGTGFSILGQLIPGNALPATGRLADVSWYTVALNGLTAWVFSEVISLNGACDGLPVVQAVPSEAPTASATIQSAISPTASLTITSTSTAQPVVTATATPVTNGQTQPTSTAQPVQATATFTPSYTPTTPPAAQVAPPDARFNNPLNIPLDSTASVLDFVSYPGGDAEDRVRWDIVGMNQNSSLSGGRARLVIAVSCFGQGTENIQFFTGGQTFVCGQTIVDREVTYDSRTGSVIITALGGDATYVQWVLTGTATRTN